MNRLIMVVVLGMSAVSCKEDGPVETPQQSVSGTLVYKGHGEGFSFSRNELLSRPFPAGTWPDFEYYVETGDDPTPLGYCLVGTTPGGRRPTFKLMSQPGTLDSARTFFQQLGEITTTAFDTSTCAHLGPAPTLKANQVWAVFTYDQKYAKMLIVNFTDSLVIDWVLQPGGGRKF